MKYALFILNFVFLALPLCAEKVGDLEYQLPSQAKDWKVVNQFENEKGKTLVYMPKNEETSSVEFFGVNTNSLSSNFDNIEIFKESLQRQFPGSDVNVNILDKNNDSLLYELSIKQNGKETFHGWGRAIVTKNGTNVLIYQTDNIANVDNARNIWLPVLKDAKVS